MKNKIIVLHLWTMIKSCIRPGDKLPSAKGVVDDIDQAD